MRERLQVVEEAGDLGSLLEVRALLEKVDAEVESMLHDDAARVP